ncbi:MAG: acyl-[Eubacterium sp.]|nr:acyl-[acyl-carrier-protein] thioesterase [Eubacterium sp.]
MIYEFESRIRFSEVDENGYLSLPALMNYLQDCATFHGEETGVGLDWIAEHRQTWVLASLRLHVFRYPKYAETIRVSTWAHGFRGFLGYRDFAADTPSGEIIARGKSDWVFMDMQANKPMNVPPEQTNAYGIEADKALKDIYGRRKIRLSDCGETGSPFVIHESNLDTNRHVNSCQYIMMAQNLLPAGFPVNHLRAEYKRQAYLGDVITPVIYEVDHGYAVTLLNKDGEPYFVGEFTDAVI